MIEARLLLRASALPASTSQQGFCALMVSSPALVHLNLLLDPSFRARSRGRGQLTGRSHAMKDPRLRWQNPARTSAKRKARNIWGEGLGLAPEFMAYLVSLAQVRVEGRRRENELGEGRRMKESMKSHEGKRYSDQKSEHGRCENIFRYRSKTDRMGRRTRTQGLGRCWCPAIF